MARKSTPSGAGTPPRLDADEDTALWRRVAGTVRPLKGRAPDRPPDVREPVRPEPDEAEEKAPKGAHAAPRPPSVRRTPPLPQLVPGGSPGLDKRTALRLRRGQIPIEGRIDLHGMTRAAAHARLTAFLADQAAAGRRCVLVITGRGAARLAKGGGVIRAQLPHWLNGPDLRPLVLAFASAQPKDGGTGAFYVYLRRRRAP